MIPAIIIIVLSILFAVILQSFDLTTGEILLLSCIAGVLIGVVAATVEVLL